MTAPVAPCSTSSAVASSICAAAPAEKEKTLMYASFLPFAVTSCALRGGTSISRRTSVNSSGFRTVGRLTVRATAVPVCPLIRASALSNGSLPTGSPSIRVMTSPLRMPASAAGPAAADVTTRPFRAGPTVRPIPEYVPCVCSCRLSYSAVVSRSVCGSSRPARISSTVGRSRTAGSIQR